MYKKDHPDLDVGITAKSGQRTSKRLGGFTLLEMMICILIFSLTLAGISTAILKVGEVSAYSDTDLSTRDSYNKLFNDLNISVHSLLSEKDRDYAEVTEAGLIVSDVVSEDSVALEGKDLRRVKAYTLTLYTKGTVQKKVLSFSPDYIQDRAPVFLTGKLYEADYKFVYDANDQIIGEALKEEKTTSCVMYSSIGEENYESYFEVLLDGDRLYQITSYLVLPKQEYQVKQASITQSCQQEVKVICAIETE